MVIEEKINQLNEKLYSYLDIIEEALQEKHLNDNFFLIDLKEFDNDIIKLIALYHPQGEFLRELAALLKITSLLAKIKNSVKFIIKNYDFNNEKIDELYQNTIISLNALKNAIKSEELEDAYSAIISYEKIAEELYNEYILNLNKHKKIEKTLIELNIAKKLERICDSSKVIIKYLLFAKEGIEL